MATTAGCQDNGECGGGDHFYAGGIDVRAYARARVATDAGVFAH